LPSSLRFSSLRFASVFPSSSLLLFSALLSNRFASPLQIPLTAPLSLVTFPLGLSRMPPGKLRSLNKPQRRRKLDAWGAGPLEKGGHVFHPSGGQTSRGGWSERIGGRGGRADHPKKGGWSRKWKRGWDERK
jgi:hypothetical protein